MGSDSAFGEPFYTEEKIETKEYMEKRAIRVKLWEGIIEDMRSDFGRGCFDTAVVICPIGMEEDARILQMLVGGDIIKVPTQKQLTLGNVEWKVARYLEDIELDVRGK